MTSKTQETMKCKHEFIDLFHREFCSKCKKFKSDLQPEAQQTMKPTYSETLNKIYESSPEHWDAAKCVCEHLGRGKCERNCPEHSENSKQPEAQPQQEGEGGLVTNIPEAIYLQLHDGLLETTVDFNQLVGVTWCQDRINDTDVAYVLQSQLSTLTAENAKLKEELERYKKSNTEVVGTNRIIKAENAKLWKALEDEVKRPFLGQYKGDNQEIINGYLNMASNAWEQFKSTLLAK